MSPADGDAEITMGPIKSQKWEKTTQGKEASIKSAKRASTFQWGPNGANGSKWEKPTKENGEQPSAASSEEKRKRVGSTFEWPTDDKVATITNGDDDANDPIEATCNEQKEAPVQGQ